MQHPKGCADIQPAICLDSPLWPIEIGPVVEDSLADIVRDIGATR